MLPVLQAGLLASCLSPCLIAKEASLTTRVSPVYVDVHSGPGRGYPVFHVLERHQDIDVLKKRTDWIKVRTQDRYQNIEGWVRSGELFPTTDSEFDETGRWQWSTAMGDMAGAQSIDMSLGYQLTRYLEAEASYGQATGDFSDIEYAYLKLNNSFRDIWRIKAYFSVGAGLLKTSPNTKLVQSEQRNENSMLTGFGLRSYLTRNFYLRLEYNQHLVLTNRDVNEDVSQWLFGLSINF